jgi:hypothetical protein
VDGSSFGLPTHRQYAGIVAAQRASFRAQTDRSIRVEPRPYSDRMPSEPTHVARPSLVSLLIGPMHRETLLGRATGFVVERASTNYLVTNFHVVSGRRPGNLANVDPLGAWPDRLAIMHHSTDGLGRWEPHHEQLYDASGAPRWLEHPEHGHRVDVIALPLADLDRVAIFPHDPWCPPRAAMPMTTGLSVIGFPFGQTVGGHSPSGCMAS